MKVYSYLRVSSKGQVEGDGPERQRQAIQAFADTHALAPAGEFFERGISGTVEGMDRPAFSDMLDSAAAAGVEAVVVERVDRLARDLMVSELLLAECRKRSLKVFAADQGALIDMAADGGDPTRVLIRQIMGALAQWEKSSLVRKLKASRERKKRLTGRCEGQKPYGYYPAEQETLVYLKSFCLDGSTPRPTYRQMAESLSLAGLRNRKGNKWTGQQIFDLLKQGKRYRNLSK